MSVYRGVIANFGFITPREFMKMDKMEISLLEAILVDMKKEMDKAKSS